MWGGATFETTVDQTVTCGPASAPTTAPNATTIVVAGAFQEFGVRTRFAGLTGATQTITLGATPRHRPRSVTGAWLQYFAMRST